MKLKSKTKNKKWNLKRNRLKYHLKRKNVKGLPRLVVFRSNNNIFTQLIDDVNHKTIISASSLDKELISAIKNAKNKVEKSTIIGECIAEKMKKEKINKIIFDRNGYKYHGRIKAVGDAIRNAEIQI
jgi:large subunit ribosomal protein L18